jgi:hypothetical protein
MNRIKALEADTNAVLKLILTELDMLASMPPEQACEPYFLDDCKRRIKRRLWEHHRAFVNKLAEDL